jgi:hypothetical protein
MQSSRQNHSGERLQMEKVLHKSEVSHWFLSRILFGSGSDGLLGFKCPSVLARLIVIDRDTEF